MKDNFNYSLDQVLKFEGGYGNDPRDPGGPTNFGITIADYRRYINSKATAADVRNMKLDDAKRIYRAAYWDALDCDRLSSGVDYCIFDYGVNSGVGRARKILARFKNVTDPVKLINAICDERMTFLRSLSTFSTFGVGWTRRVMAVRNGAIQLTHRPTSVIPTVIAAGATGVAAATSVVAKTQPQHWHYALIAAGVLVLIGCVIYIHKRRKNAR